VTEDAIVNATIDAVEERGAIATATAAVYHVIAAVIATGAKEDEVMGLPFLVAVGRGIGMMTEVVGTITDVKGGKG